MSRSNYIFLISLFFFTVLTFVLFLNTQDSLNYEACPKCDGNDYLAIYNYFQGGIQEYKVHFPFNSRITVPFITSILPFQKAVLNFHLVNLIFSILSIGVIFYLWTELQITNTLKCIGLFWLLFHWVGIIRLNLFDPVTVDVPLYLFHALLLLIVYKKKYNSLILLSIVATTQKESFPAYLLVFLGVAFIYNKVYEKYFKLTPILLSIVVSFTINYLIIYFFPSIEAGRNSFITIGFHIKQLLINPLLIIKWIVAIFTGFGALFFLALDSKKYDWSPENTVLLAFTGLSLILGLIAGGDFTRITFLGFPFIMTFILIRISDKPMLLIILSLILSIPVFRLFSSIPFPADYVLFNHEWYPEFASNGTVALWGVYMVLSYLVLKKVTKIIE